MKRTKIITKQIEKRFSQVGNQENVSDPLVIAKWFNPYGRSTWFATEYDPETRTCFGYVVGELGPDCDEWGYFSLDEIESTTVRRFGCELPLERDLYWSEQVMSKACPDALVKLGR